MPGGAPRQRKRLDRSQRQRTDQALDTRTNTPSTSADLSKTADLSVPGSLTKEMRRSHEYEEEEEVEERMRQEERERELRTLELLERRIGIEDGSLKRLGKIVITVLILQAYQGAGRLEENLHYIVSRFVILIADTLEAKDTRS